MLIDLTVPVLNIPLEFSIGSEGYQLPSYNVPIPDGVVTVELDESSLPVYEEWEYLRDPRLTAINQEISSLSAQVASLKEQIATECSALGVQVVDNATAVRSYEISLEECSAVWDEVEAAPALTYGQMLLLNDLAQLLKNEPFLSHHIFVALGLPVQDEKYARWELLSLFVKVFFETKLQEHRANAAGIDSGKAWYQTNDWRSTILLEWNASLLFDEEGKSV